MRYSSSSVEHFNALFNSDHGVSNWHCHRVYDETFMMELEKNQITVMIWIHDLDSCLSLVTFHCRQSLSSDLLTLIILLIISERTTICVCFPWFSMSIRLLCAFRYAQEGCRTWTKVWSRSKFDSSHQWCPQNQKTDPSSDLEGIWFAVVLFN